MHSILIRFLLKLKRYKKNPCRAASSIENGYLLEEAVDYCARYMTTTPTTYNREPRNYQDEKYFGKGTTYDFLNDLEMKQAHFCILTNCRDPELEAYYKTFVNEKSIHQTHSRRGRSRSFPDFPTWLLNKGGLPQSLECLQLDERVRATKYQGFFIGGHKFRTKESEMLATTQCSGVMLRTRGIDFYGKLTDVIEVSYGCGERKFVLFRCDWATESGVTVDRFGITLVSFDNLLEYPEAAYDGPFILAKYATQVFYVQEAPNSHWSVVIKTKPRDLYELEVNQDEDEDEDDEEIVNEENV